MVIHFLGGITSVGVPGGWKIGGGGTPCSTVFCCGVYLEYKVVNSYGSVIFFRYFGGWSRQQDVSLFQRFWTPGKRVDPET